MPTYLIGEHVQFRQAVTRKDLDCVINAGEKARIVAIALNGSYTVKLDKDGLIISGIMGDDIKAPPAPQTAWGTQRPHRRASATKKAKTMRPKADPPVP